MAEREYNFLAGSGSTFFKAEEGVNFIGGRREYIFWRGQGVHFIGGDTEYISLAGDFSVRHMESISLAGTRSTFHRRSQGVHFIGGTKIMFVDNGAHCFGAKVHQDTDHKLYMYIKHKQYAIGTQGHST